MSVECFIVHEIMKQVETSLDDENNSRMKEMADLKSLFCAYIKDGVGDIVKRSNYRNQRAGSSMRPVYSFKWEEVSR